MSQAPPPPPSGVPKMDEARANLMSSIRQVGGFSNAGLKPPKHREPTPKAAAKMSKGDLMKDLSRCLANSRGGLSQGKRKK